MYSELVHINYEGLRLRQENDPELEQILKNQERSGMNLQLTNYYIAILRTQIEERKSELIFLLLIDELFLTLYIIQHTHVRGTVDAGSNPIMFLILPLYFSD